MFKKILASIGHGGAKVDFRLSNSQVALGESLHGEVVVKGGNVEQHINIIEVHLFLDFHHHEQLHTHKIETFSLPVHRAIQASEQLSFPIQYVIPNNWLLSSPYVSYYFSTNLDIAGAVDASDRDFLEVVPNSRMNQVLSAISQLGFYEKHGSKKFNGKVQEFEYAPGSFLAGKVEEIEFFMTCETEGILLHLELDAFSFSGEKEIKRQIWLANSLLENTDELTVFLIDQMEDMLRNPHSYDIYYHHGHYYHSSHHEGSGIGGVVAGAVGGFLAGMLISEVIDEVFDEEDDEENDEDDPDFEAFEDEED
ncbi:sporulation-control protein [Thermoactinomyces sp. DSM 45891]|uniref:sporulation protein n=1 Tax=Thermoactinomyces sp. DSM 45891 TaxID=1761907 RepID=UPI000923F3F5|nr:sporulation protein [Thermoactinomyces sp. DSM 45891]SFX11974.1 sporulation-control protein [Thermoactinomyces sp. DSM 45891]